MENKQENSIDKSARIEACKKHLALCKIGAPPNAYLFSVIGVTMAFVAAIFVFGEKTPDGKIDPMVIIRWINGLSGWSHLILLVLVSFEMAVWDLFGWMLSAWIAQLCYGENVTVRRVAFWRLGVQIALAAVVTLLFALFPQKFPHPNGHFPFMLFGFFGIPIAFAALYLRRASRAPLQ